MLKLLGIVALYFVMFLDYIAACLDLLLISDLYRIMCHA